MAASVTKWLFNVWARTYGSMFVGFSRGQNLILALCILLQWPSMAYADFFIKGEGKNQPFCERILVTLNKTRPRYDTPSDRSRPWIKKMPCISKTVLSMPGVSEPPWEKLDLSQHEDLAKEMIVMSSEGIAAYSREVKLEPEKWPTVEQKRRSLEAIKVQGAELFALRMPEYGEVVRVSLRFKDELCGAPPQTGVLRSYDVFATPDFKKIALKETRDALPVGRPLLYQGKYYYALFADIEMQLYIRDQFGYESPMCTIVFSDNADSKGKAKWP